MMPPGSSSGRLVRIANLRLLPTGGSSPSGPGGPRLHAGEPFWLQLRFALQDGPWLSGPDVASWFEVSVRACKLGEATTRLLASERIGAVAGEEPATVDLAMTGLEPGQYRLITLVTFGAAAEVAGFCDGPVVTVSGPGR
jgi:hypothetical protein